MAALSAGGAGLAAKAADANAADGTDWAQVRLLLAVRFRTWFRFTSVSVWRILAHLLGLLVIAAMAVGLGFFAWAAGGFAVEAGPETVRRVVHAAFLFVFAMRTASPLLGFQQNESLDVTKIQTLPVSPRTVFAATFLGMATAPGTWFWGVPLGVLVARVAAGPAQVAAGVVAAAAVILSATAIGHLVLYAFLGLFRSRKWRDLSMVLATLVTAGLFAAIRWSADTSNGRMWAVAAEKAGEVAQSLLFLPSWWGAHAVVGDGLPSLLPLLATIPLVWVCARASARVEERLWYGEVEEAPRTADASRSRAGRLGRGTFAALFSKDVALLVRDPGVRVHLLQQIGFTALPIGFMAFRDAEARVTDGHWPAMTVFLTLIALLATSAVSLNPLGSEGPGLVHVLGTPVDRVTLLRSKALALTAAVGGSVSLLAAAGAVGMGWFGGAPFGAVAAAGATSFFECLAASGVLAAAGCVVGVWFPRPLTARARDGRGATKGAQRVGCLRMLGGAAMFPIVLAAVTPVLLLFRHPYLFAMRGTDSSALLWVTAPAAFAWAGLCLWGAAHFGAMMLRTREEAVVAATLAEVRG